MEEIGCFISDAGADPARSTAAAAWKLRLQIGSVIALEARVAVKVRLHPSLVEAIKHAVSVSGSISMGMKPLTVNTNSPS